MTRVVQIVMATRNGARFLPAQLNSIAEQKHQSWQLLVGDDRSDDGTRAILRGFAARHPGRVCIVTGPGQGVAANFLNLTQRAVERAPGMPLVFADQDDLWWPGRLGSALAGMDAGAGDVVAHASRIVLIDAQDRYLGCGGRVQRGPSFGNALVQNVLPGHALALSPAAARTLARSAPVALAAGVAFHDWWAYLLVAAVGGRITLGTEVTVGYRQHRGAQFGYGARHRIARACAAISGTYADWISANLAALARIEDVSPEARRLAESFSDARINRRAHLSIGRHGVHRQGGAGDMALRALAFIGRL
ncbi:glycosyltransferase [Pseudooceanicola aestuarii]|uniref:glycosyltransferase n=1 Tax=Pseudooceanicola aestuarii TaxID=2697319 RepID=UPI0013D492BB|nr:glycosyltransferase [Pseudooceanicola aestuarii]